MAVAMVVAALAGCRGRHGKGDRSDPSGEVWTPSKDGTGSPGGWSGFQPNVPIPASGYASCLNPTHCADNDNCEPGSECNLDLDPPTCVKLYCLPDGAPCDSNLLCASKNCRRTNQPDLNVCWSKPSPEGWFCAHLPEYDIDDRCEEGLLCNDGSNNCVVPDSGGEYAPCSSDAHCEAGLRCLAPYDCDYQSEDDFHCVEPGRSGASCCSERDCDTELNCEKSGWDGGGYCKVDQPSLPDVVSAPDVMVPPDTEPDVEGCTDECTPGEQACSGANIMNCGFYDADSCVEWDTPASCGSWSTCQKGACVLTCTDECTTLGLRSCSGKTVVECKQSDSDPCLERITIKTCDAACLQGECTCDSECSPGSKMCALGNAQTCVDLDQDGCGNWAPAQPCAHGYDCAVGACSKVCDDGCPTAGAVKCSGTKIATCGNTDSDECLEWGAPASCGASATCTGTGTCTCIDACDEVGFFCSGKLRVECGYLDADACLDRSAPAGCGGSDVCFQGECGPPPPVVINEIGDFVELRGPPGATLEAWSIVQTPSGGAIGKSTIALVGSLSESGYFVVGQTPAGGADQVTGLLSTLAPRTFELRYDDLVADAVAYGAVTAGAGEGQPAPAPKKSGSIGRDENGTDTGSNGGDFWYTAAPSPGGPNTLENQLPVVTIDCPPVAAVGLAASVTGSAVDPDGAVMSAVVESSGATTKPGKAGDTLVTWSTPGPKTATLTATDDAGGNASASCTIQVVAASPPVVLMLAPVVNGSVSAGQTTKVTADVTPAAGRTIAAARLRVDAAVVQTVTLPPYQFQWTPDAATPPGQTVLLTVEAEDDLGVIGDSGARSVTVANAAPVAALTVGITGAGAILADASGTKDEAPDGLVYRWDFDGGPFDTAWSAERTAAHVYPADGIYTVRVEVRDAALQVGSASKTVELESMRTLSGTLGDATWYGRILLAGDVVIPAGVTIDVLPGTTVVADMTPNETLRESGIVLHGVLRVTGNSAAPAVFHPAPPQEGWDGVAIESGGRLEVQNAVFLGGRPAFTVAAGGTADVSAAVIDGTGPRVLKDGVLALTGVTITPIDPVGLDVSGTVAASALTVNGEIVLSSAEATFDGLIQTGSAGNGITVTGASSRVTVRDASISGNARVGLEVYRGALTLEDSHVRDNANEGLRIVASKPADIVVNRTSFSENGSAGSMKVKTHAGVVKGGTGTGTFTGSLPPSVQSALILYVGGRVTGTPGADDLTGQVGELSFGSELAIHSGSLAPSPLKTVSLLDASSANTGSVDVTVASLDSNAHAQVSAWLPDAGVGRLTQIWFSTFPDLPSSIYSSGVGKLNAAGMLTVDPDGPAAPHLVVGGEALPLGKTTWSGDVWISGRVTIPPGSTLVVLPGSTLHFVRYDMDGGATGDAMIYVAPGDGSVTIVGTPEAPITATPEPALATYPDYKFLETDKGSVGTVALAHLTVTGSGLWPGQLAGHLNIDHVVIRDGDSTGLGIFAGADAHVTVRDSRIEGASGSGLDVYRGGSGIGTVTLERNAATGCGGTGFRIGPGVQVARELTATDNQLGVDLRSGGTLTASTMKLNRDWGLAVAGNNGFTVSRCNITSNQKEGVLGTTIVSATGYVITESNIYGNGLSGGVTFHEPAVSLTSGEAEVGTKTARWNPVPAGEILHYDLELSATGGGATSGIAVLLYAGPHRYLPKLYTHLSPPTSAEELYVEFHLEDTSAVNGGTATLLRTVTVGEVATNRDLAALSTGVGKLTAKGNYWGPAGPPPGSVWSITEGAVDTSGYATLPIPTAGAKP